MTTGRSPVLVSCHCGRVGPVCHQAAHGDRLVDTDGAPRRVGVPPGPVRSHEAVGEVAMADALLAAAVAGNLVVHIAVGVGELVVVGDVRRHVVEVERRDGETLRDGAVEGHRLWGAVGRAGGDDDHRTGEQQRDE